MIFDPSRLVELIRSFSRMKVAVVGDLVLDEYLFGVTSRISREAPVPIVDLDGSRMRPGGAANTAANLAAMGASTSAVGIVGNDEPGRNLVRLLESMDINVRNVIGIKGRSTTTKIRVMAGDLHTTRQQLIRIDRGERTDLNPEYSKRLAEKIGILAPKQDAIALSDYGFGVLSEPVLLKLRKVSRSIPVVADSRFRLMDLSQVTAVTPNEPESEQALGIPIAGEDTVRKAGQALLRRLKCQYALITRGNKGMALFEKSKKAVFLPIAQDSEAVDVTGAGDTVVAAFTLALAAGAQTAEAAYIANHAASVAVSKSGAVAVSAEEIISSIESNAQ